jgi:transcription elongation GreA/GreB family factor
MSLNIEFKKRVLDLCLQMLRERIQNAEKAMNEAQLAANGEEKSSAGDKYETSRAMGHRDRDMYARQFVEAKNELLKVEKLNLEPLGFVKTGSIMEANGMLYFVATGIGKVEIDQKTVMVISKESPIAAAMMGKKLNDSFQFNGKTWTITELI